MTFLGIFVLFCLAQLNALEAAIFIISLIYLFKEHNYVVETREEIYRCKMYRFHLCIAFDKSCRHAYPRLPFRDLFLEIVYNSRTELCFLSVAL